VDKPADNATKPAGRVTRLEALVWSVAFLALGLVGLSTLWWPMGRDQGIYAFVGSVITHGGTSYVDVWEPKGPATHLIYALSQWLFGGGMWGIRLLDLSTLTAASWFAWRALSRLGAGSGALFGVWLFAAWYWMPGYWETAQPDTWVAMLLLAALLLSASEDGSARPGAALAAGVLIGLGAMFKPLFSCFGLILLIGAWPQRGTAGTAAAWRGVAAALAGAAAVCVAVAGWLLFTGAMGPFLQIQLGFNWAVHRLSQSLIFVAHRKAWVGFASEPGILLVLPLVAIGAWRLWSRRRRLALAALAALLLSFAGITLQSKYYPYHFAPLLAPLALLAAFGMAPATKSGLRFRRWMRATATLIAVAIVVVNLVPLAPGAWRWARYVTGQMTPGRYYAQFDIKTDYDLQGCRRAAERVKKMTGPDDTIMVWALDPLINYLAERMPPSRFAGHYPLTRGELNPYEAEWRREFMQDIKAHPPELFLIADHDQNNLMPMSSLHYIDEFPEFKAFLSENYKPEGNTGTDRFYTLRRVD
jgi:4-amino-4-deoxy-L-arabinose transferase-like glycosyltransferase